MMNLVLFVSFSNYFLVYVKYHTIRYWSYLLSVNVHLRTKLREFKQSLRLQQAQSCLAEAHDKYLTDSAALDANGSGGKSNKSNKKKQQQDRKLVDDDLKAVQQAQLLVKDVQAMAKQDEALAREEQAVAQLYMCMCRGIVQVIVVTYDEHLCVCFMSVSSFTSLSPKLNTSLLLLLLLLLLLHTMTVYLIYSCC
jgi:hypothetical protein